MRILIRRFIDFSDKDIYNILNIVIFISDKR